jgi:hypothetical protein
VDWVPVLKGHHWLALWEHGTDLSWSLHRIWKGNALDAMEIAAHVMSTRLLNERENGGMLQTRSAIDFLGLNDFVGLVDGRGFKHGHIFAFPLQQQLITLLEA